MSNLGKAEKTAREKLKKASGEKGRQQEENN